MTRLSELPEAMAERYRGIDDIGHVALVAACSAAMIGSARYIIDAGDAACEGIDVADRLQGMGLAPILLTRLADHAASSSIRCMSGDTATNAAIILPAKQTGFAGGESPGTAGSCTFLKDLPGMRRRLSRSEARSATRGTAHGQLDTGPEFLSLTPHGNEGGARDAGLRRGLRS